MDLSDLLRLCRRRWYVVLLGLMMTMGLVLLALRLVPATYESTADVLLLPAKTTVGPGNNPYLALDGLQTIADVVSRAMVDETSVRSVEAAGGSDRFEVSADPTTNGPVILISVDEESGAAAENTLGLVLDRLPTTLQSIQQDAGVPQAFRITSLEITENAPVEVRKSQLRAALVALAGGIALTLLVVSIVDTVLTRRREAGSAVPIQTSEVAADDDSPEEAEAPATSAGRSSIWLLRRAGETAHDSGSNVKPS